MVLRQVVREVPDLAGSTLVHHGGTLFVDSVTGMILSRVGYVGPTGYERVNVDGKDRSAHRVVFEAVVGPIGEGLTINHKDGVKHNNRPDNLEAVTQSANVRHAYEIGLRVGNGLTGCRTRPSRLSDDDVRRIVEAPRGQIGDLARELGIARSYAYQIRSGRKRPHVPR